MSPVGSFGPARQQPVHPKPSRRSAQGRLVGRSGSVVFPSRPFLRACPSLSRAFRVRENSVASPHQHRSRCSYGHDGGDHGGAGGEVGEGARGARGHGAYGGRGVSARLRGLARETEQIVAAGTYRAPSGREVRLAAAVQAARNGTRMYGPEPVRVPERASAGVGTRIEVTGESSLEAARRLAGATEPGGSRREPAVLSFASASPKLSASFEQGGAPIPAAAISTARRLGRRRCAVPPRSTPACCEPPSTTTTTGPTVTRSTPTE